MATYFGGETILAFTDLSGTTGTLGTSTIYTVPAGRYAKITLNNLSSAAAFTFRAGEFQSASATDNSQPEDEYIVGPGRNFQITAGGAGVAYYILVREYAIP